MPEHQEHEHLEHDCPDCNPQSEPVTPIILMAVGGMLLFFSFFFGLIGFIAMDGFLTPAAIVFIVSALMVIAGFMLYRKNSERRHRIRHMRLLKAKCQYCGTQNKAGARRCDSCGAPLK